MAIHYRFSWFCGNACFYCGRLTLRKKLARWIAVFSTVISLIMIFIDSELYSNGKIITQCIIQGILNVLTFLTQLLIAISKLISKQDRNTFIILAWVSDKPLSK